MENTGEALRAWAGLGWARTKESKGVGRLREGPRVCVAGV